MISGVGSFGHILNHFSQFLREGLWNGSISGLFAKGDGSFKSLQARKTGYTTIDMFFNLRAGDFIQLMVEIFGKLFEHFQTMLMVVAIATALMVLIIVGHFQNTPLIFL